MAKEFARRWHKSTPGKRPDKVYISSPDLRVLISKQLKGKMARDFSLFIADSKYYCTPLKDAEEIIKWSNVDRKIWVRERFDCDDFAHVLKAHFAEAAYVDGKRRRSAHCFGIVWGMLPYAHAINWMVDEKRKLHFIEPQSDKIFSPRKVDKEIWFMLV